MLIDCRGYKRMHGAFPSVSLLGVCSFVSANEQTKSEREEAVDSKAPIFIFLSLGVCVRARVVEHTTHYHFPLTTATKRHRFYL